MKYLSFLLVFLLNVACDHKKKNSSPRTATKFHSKGDDPTKGADVSVPSLLPPVLEQTDEQNLDHFADMSERFRLIGEMNPGKLRTEETKRMLSNVTPDEMHLVIPWLDANIDDDEFAILFPTLLRREDWSSLKDYETLYNAIFGSKLEKLRIYGMVTLGRAMASNLGLEKAASMIASDYSNNSRMLEGLLGTVKGKNESLEFLLTHPELPLSSESLETTGMWLAEDATLRHRALSAGESGEIHEKVAEGVYFTWVRNDPIEASKWMSLLQAGRFKDSMIRRTCEYLIQSGKRIEAARWAPSITDPNVRKVVDHMITATKGP